MHKTNWIYFPKSDSPPSFIRDVVRAFENCENRLHTNTDDLMSNDVLAILRPDLEAIGYQVESGKRAAERIRVPVLFGKNGMVEKAFEADAWNRESRIVIEVEAGRGYTNNQFLKDLFQACMMQDVDYCGIAVRNRYINSNDFDKVVAFFETLYTSGRLKLPLKGVLIVGYGHVV
jgi:hypothetical protein